MNLFNGFIAEFLAKSPERLIWPIASNYIAGPKRHDAIRIAKHYNSLGMRVEIDFLGEKAKNVQETYEVTEEYKNLIMDIHKYKLNAGISKKPTHLGLLLDKNLCFQNINDIAQTAQKYHVTFCLDMEDHTVTSDTINMYLELQKKYDPWPRIAIQAYLKRTKKDIEKLIARNARVRLCKGIYNEPKKIAHKQMAIINNYYDFYLEKLLRGGCYAGIATQDDSRINFADLVIRDLNLKRKNYEFQKLLGVKNALFALMARLGHPLCIYIPYGPDWKQYSIRRFKENPKLIKYIAKEYFFRKKIFL